MFNVKDCIKLDDLSSCSLKSLDDSLDVGCLWARGACPLFCFRVHLIGQIFSFSLYHGMQQG